MHKLFKTILNRPVTVIMFFIAVLILGLASIYKIPMELKPDTAYPKLIVTASWPNASPETMENFVTSKLESEIAGLSSVYKISSESYSGRSNITIEYLRDADMNFAYMDLNEKLFTVRKNLPPEVRRSVSIQKYLPDDQDETATLLEFNISGRRELYEVFQFAVDNLKKHYSSLSGISKVEITGASERELRILINRDKAKFLNINPYLVTSKLAEFSGNNAAGIIRKGELEYNLVCANRLLSTDDLKNIIITRQNGITIYLKDLAVIKDELGSNYSLTRINAQPTVTLSLYKESGANSIDVADAALAMTEKLKTELPEDIKIDLSNDSTKEMRENLDDIKYRSILSILIIALVLIIFMRDVKMPLVMLITIFLSLCLTFIYLYLAGYTINIITISGIAMAMGMLTDNSIVVIENIYSYHNKGYTGFQAALKGSKEVVLPMLASTITSVVVFLPFLYLSGEKRLYWMPLAVVVGVSQITSLFTAFVLTPVIANLMIGKKMVRAEVIEHKDIEIKESFFHTLLKLLIHNKVLTILATILFFYLSYYLFDKYVDKGEFFRWDREDGVFVNLSMPTGSTIDMADSIIAKFEKKILSVGGYKKVSTSVHSRWSNIRVEYTDEQLKTTNPFKMEAALIGMAHNFQGPGIGIYNSLNPSGGYNAGGSTSKNYSNTVTIKGYNFDRLKAQAVKMGDYLLQNSRIKEINVNSTNRWWNPEMFNFVFKLDREKIAGYDVTVRDVVWFVLANISGVYPTPQLIGSKEVPTSVKFADYKDFNVRQLKDLVYPYSQNSFRLGQVGDFVKEQVLPSITKENQAYVRMVRFDYQGSEKQSSEFQENLIATYPLDPGYSFDKEKVNYMTEEDKSEIYLALLLAIVLVFFSTAILYESILEPFVIILTVPLGMTGVFLTFFLLDESFNRDAYMGMILLAGITVSNSIVLVNHINDLRKEGLDALHSILIGTSQRVRPILMTTFTGVVGILPLIINAEKDKNFWYTLSLTSLGGMVASTVFVLTIIPVLYAAQERFKMRMQTLLRGLKG